MRGTALFRSLFVSLTLPERFTRALNWLRRHSVPGKGIAVTNVNLNPYPEVSGYLIPTLLRWGERDLAHSYGRWLLTVQNPDGSWSDSDSTSPYTFDTGQILKGLLALMETEPGYQEAVQRGCDWMLSQIQDDGRVTTPVDSQWNLPGGRVVPEAIHLYALEPLRRAGRLWGLSRYEEAVERALAYYLADPALIRFDTLSHFHAYILEALIDLERPERTAEAMAELTLLQSATGGVPAYRDSGWLCSPGLFQYALIWYRLGERQQAERAFACACRMQNRSGGFYGGYGRGATYFPCTEISWAVKYFLDALNWKINTSFETASVFPQTIDPQDGRYRLVAKAVRRRMGGAVLEAGCGKGRFLRALRSEFPETRLSGLDLSRSMLACLPEGVTPIRGSLLQMPLADSTFDVVFCVEALEHAVNLPGALRELTRVVAPGGILVIVDKNLHRLGRLDIAEWEQWFDAEEVAELLQNEEFDVEVHRNIPYDCKDGRDGLFLGWIATRKSGNPNLNPT